MVYKFARGYRLPSTLDPQLVGDRLSTLRADHGAGFTPAVVVEDAREAGSPLHDAFTWDDTDAARKQREQEARMLTRAVVMVQAHPDGHVTQQHAFVSVIERDSAQDRYMSMVTAMSDSEYREQILNRALDEAIAWRVRYMDLRELARIFEAIDKADAQRAKQRARSTSAKRDQQAAFAAG